MWGIWGSGRSDQSFCLNADILFASLSLFRACTAGWYRITPCLLSAVLAAARPPYTLWTPKMRAALLTLSVWSALCNCQSIGCGQSLSECTLYTPSKKACNRSSNCNQASHRPAPKCPQNKSGGWSDESGCHAIADGRRDCPPQVDGEDPHRGSDIIDPRPGGQAWDRTATKCHQKRSLCAGGARPATVQRPQDAVCHRWMAKTPIAARIPPITGPVARPGIVRLQNVIKNRMCAGGARPATGPGEAAKVGACMQWNHLPSTW